MKIRTAVLGLMLSVLVAPAAAADTTQLDPILRITDGTVVGHSELQRHPTRITATLTGGDMEPGSAITVWWRIYNRPRFCAVPYACEVADLDDPRVGGSQLQAAATYTHASDGSFVLVAPLYRTAARTSIGRFADSHDRAFIRGPGLRRPLRAHVQLLVASHGRIADPNKDGPDIVYQQLHTPTGGSLDCRDPNVANRAPTYRCGVVQRVDHAAP